MKGMIRNEIKVQNDKKNVENDETRSKKTFRKKVQIKKFKNKSSKNGLLYNFFLIFKFFINQES